MRKISIALFLSISFACSSQVPRFQLSTSGTGTSPNFYESSSDLIGIGTSTPTATLHIVPSGTSPSAALFISNYPAAPYALYISGSTGSASVPDLIVSKSGRTGIGLTNPLAHLDITDNPGDGAPILQATPVLGASSDPSLYVDDYGYVGLGSTDPATMVEVYGYTTLDGATGIGTAYPASMLDIAGGVSIGAYAGSISAPTNGLIVSGNVGIGTSSPTVPLQVVGTISATSLQLTGGATSGYILSSDASGNASWLNPSFLGSGQWAVATGGSDIYNTNIGNVGIGTSTPTAALTVTSTSTSPSTLINIINGGTGVTSWPTSLEIKRSGSIAFGGSTFPFSFTDFIVASNGNVGIGTSTPSYSLDVNGDIHTTDGADFDGIVHMNDQVYIASNTAIGGDANIANRVQIGGVSATTDKLNVGGTARLNDNDIYFRAGTDTYQGLGYYGSSTGTKVWTNTVSGTSTAVSVNGPVLYGYDGGALATTDGGNNIALQWTNNGKVMIGSVPAITSGTPLDNNYLLYVQKGILTEKVKVALIGGGNWSDYVFDKNYKLAPLSDVETYIKKNKHLPGVPSADEVCSEGIDMAEMDATLLKKIEELTLYVLDLKKENTEIKKQLTRINK